MARPMQLPTFVTTLAFLAGTTVFAAEDAGQAHERPGLLDVDPGSAVWVIVLFVMLLIVLGKFAWGPILKGLQDREGKIRGDLDHAERSAKQAQATLQDYEKRLADAGQEVRDLIERGRSDAQKVAGQMRQTAEAEIDQLRRRAEADITAAKELALNEIYARTAALATDVAGRILKRQINTDDQQRLVQDAIDELDTTTSN